jgi:hypothetical protein
MIIFPYTLPRAKINPNIKPNAREIKVNINVRYSPSRSFGNDSIKKLKKSDRFFSSFIYLHIDLIFYLGILLFFFSQGF